MLLDSFLSNLIKEGATPSYSCAICSKDEILYKKIDGFRCLDTVFHSLTEDTLFDLASLTKILASTTLACLFIQTNKLKLDDKIGTFFDSKYYADTTIYDLLTHQAGFISEKRIEHHIKNKEDVLDFILNDEPIYKKGEKVVYSCFGFIVLGKILEKIGGNNLNSLCKEYIYSKLDMSQTTFLPDLRNEFAYNEKQSDDNFYPGIVHDENARFLGGISGNAGLFSSLNDMIKFGQMILSENFITKELTSLFGKSLIKYKDENRGLGFKIFDEDLFGHTGFTGTSITFNRKNQTCAILLTNRIHPTRENTKLLDKRKDFYKIFKEMNI